MPEKRARTFLKKFANRCKRGCEPALEARGIASIGPKCSGHSCRAFQYIDAGVRPRRWASQISGFCAAKSAENAPARRGVAPSFWFVCCTSPTQGTVGAVTVLGRSLLWMRASKSRSGAFFRPPSSRASQGAGRSLPRGGLLARVIRPARLLINPDHVPPRHHTGFSAANTKRRHIFVRQIPPLPKSKFLPASPGPRILPPPDFETATPDPPPGTGKV